MMKGEVEQQQVVDTLASLLDFDFAITASGHKSSEADGRTASDIRRDRAQQKEESTNGPE